MGSNDVTQQVFRQRSSLGLAGVCAATALFVLGSLARNWADTPQPLFASWVLFGLAVVWSVFVRPAVVIDQDGVTLRNLLRDVHVPWGRLSDVKVRWNLTVYVGERGYSAWAISSQAERPRGVSGGMFAVPLPSRLGRQARIDAMASDPAPTVTASMIARSIEAAKTDYDKGAAGGQPRVATDSGVRVTWVPLALVVLLLPAVAVVALSLA